jgi:hypothetical protein
MDGIEYEPVQVASPGGRTVIAAVKGPPHTSNPNESTRGNHGEHTGST